MSDVENVDIRLGSYSRDDDRNEQSESELNLDLGSNGPQQSSNLIGEEFRSLFNTNSRENSDMTIETTKMLSEEITNQMSRKLNEIRESLNYQIHDAITSEITEKVLLSIQNTLGKQGRVNYTVVDQGSCGPHEGTKSANFTTVDQDWSGLQRNPKVESGQKTRKNRSKTWFTQEDCRQISRQSSVDSYICEQYPTPHMVPEFLTGRPMQSREPLQSQNSNNDESQDTVPWSLRLQHQLLLLTLSTV